MKKISEMMRDEEAKALTYPDLKDLKAAKCEVCGENLYTVVKIFNKEVLKPVTCSCEMKKWASKFEKIDKENQRSFIERYQKISITDRKSSDETFETAVTDKDNKEIFKFVKHYCESFKRAVTENTGLYIFGKRGRGKSFLGNCIYNYLNRDFKVLMINLCMYSNELKKGYEEKKEREVELLEATKMADLLIIDDLGTEVPGKWLTEKIFNLINYREMVKKPLVITSNLNYEALESFFKDHDPHSRIKSRIQGLCLDIKLNGPDRREDSTKFSWLLGK